ncbi:MAG: metallophosphoesterase [Christensenellales bacterium]
MKIYAISDLHLSGACNKPMDIFGSSWEGYWEKIKQDWCAKVDESDLVLLCGDLSWGMTTEEAKPDLDQLADLKGKKIIIKGNHDYWWSSLSKVRAIVDKSVMCLQNDCIRVDNVLVCGSRLWTMGSNNKDDEKILNREYLRLQMSLDKMEKMRKDDDWVVAMCHYPPFDVSMRPNKFTELMSMHRVDAVVYGHLHGKDCRALKCVEIDGIPYFLSSCDLVDNNLVLLKEF